MLTAKKFFFLSVFTFFPAFFACQVGLCAEPDLSVSVTPSYLRTGDRGAVTITSEDGDVELVSGLPSVKGIRWLGQGTSSSVRIVNFSMTKRNTLECYFVAGAAGKYVIPPFAVNVDGKKLMTRELTFDVGGGRNSSSPVQGRTAQNVSSKRIGNVVFAEAAFPGVDKNTLVYAGEEIPVVLRLFVAYPYRAVYGLPEFSTSDGVSVRFHDYKDVNKDAPMFGSIEQSTAEKNSRRYNVITFSTRVRALAPGKLTLSFSLPVKIIDRDFFFEEVVAEQTVQASLPELEIAKLPPPPEKVPFSGLVGAWKVTGSLSNAPYLATEPVTMKISVRGDSQTETLVLPEMVSPDFRVYPAETKKVENGVDASITLIPLSNGKKRFLYSFCWFDPGKASYETFKLDETLDVAGQTAPSSAPVMASPVAAVQDAGGNGKTSVGEKKSSEILYLKNDVSCCVPVPVWKEHVLLIILLLPSIGLAFYLVSILYSVRKRTLASNPGYLRRRSASARKKSLLKKIKSSDLSSEADGLSSEITRFLNDAMGLPDGTSLTETSQEVRKTSPELAASLDVLAEAVWQPAAKERLNGDFRAKLVKMLSKFCLVALLVGVLTPCVSASDERAEGKDVMTLYDTGEFEKALDFYRARLSSDSASEAVLYNMGNCYWNLGDLPRALVCYERALSLAPRDSDVRENLDLVRRRLSLEEKFRIASPSDVLPYVVNSFRSDEWLLAASGALAILFFVLGVSNFALSSGKWRKYFACVTSVFVIVFLVAAFYPKDSAPYGTAVAVEHNVPVYSLPSETSGRVLSAIRDGQIVDVEEVRPGFLRIKSGVNEGWIKSSSAVMLKGDLREGI